MRINEILLQEQKLDEVPTLGQIASGVRGAVAGFQQGQQQRAVQQNTQAVAKAALQQWNNKLIQLQQAGIASTQWENHLADFVEKIMLRNYKITDLEDTRGVENAMRAVIDAGMDRRKLEPAFNTLVQQTLVARLDPTKTAYQSPAAQRTVGPGAKQAPGAQQQLNPSQAAQAAAQAMRAARINPQAAAQEIQKVAGGPLAVRTTNNTMVDALLQSLGIQVR
jgi:hypothetical protein